MPTKPRSFREGSYYHVFNRGVEKRTIFQSRRDFQRFLSTMVYYTHDQPIPFAINERLGLPHETLPIPANPEGLMERIKIVAYCLMPNHYHLLVKELIGGGTSRFLSDLQNSYTKYFNKKHERVGVLFQGTFKAKEITDEPSLRQLTRYIHLNPLVSRRSNPEGLMEKPQEWLYSSYPEWINLKNPHIVDGEEIKRWVTLAGGVQKYREFTESKIGKSSETGIEDLVIE